MVKEPRGRVEHMNTIMNDVAYDPVMFKALGNTEVRDAKVAGEVESLFLYQLLQEMDKTVERNEDSLFSSGEESTYKSLFNQELARTLAQGTGLGIKDMVEKELAGL